MAADNEITMEKNARNKPNLLRLAGISAGHYLGLLSQDRLHLRRGRLGHRYAIQDGRIYKVFRETVCCEAATPSPTVLVVGFKLRLLGDKGFGHWLFQRVCILTTPFWSGFKGFRAKLWMVSPTSGHYLGVYDWDGQAKALEYARVLERILKPLSRAGSVWYALNPGLRLDAYLMEHDLQVMFACRTFRHGHAIV